ncbi:hypothetical protein D3C76_988230 [compost metagenome]|uniref:hypothetical protein n=1 Tax=Pseudomonas putida TaxID=303 RepID=UPI000FBB2C76|nr:hypothetical protein [Pseudomonas putida]EKT4477116.1 hypothetical protein [Pseudomonas putida]WPK02521.1 hypothetical protein R6U79_09825 [Pseudomonas putida]
MIDLAGFDKVCRQTGDLDDVLNARLRMQVGDALGLPFNAMFPAFAEAFPQTTLAILNNFSIPIALFKKFMGEWLSYLVAERDTTNLFFNLVPLAYETQGASFEEEHAMLPVRWKELYRYFSSIVISEESIKPMNWRNTPFPYEGRLSLERYRQLCGVKKAQVRSFAQSVGSEQLYCWLLTDDQDALFIDEQRCDRKVYHVKRNDFENYSVLEDPEGTLDAYLAHYVSSLSSAGFDFCRSSVQS